MRKPVVLYELFPLWVLLLAPDSWIITVPALFLLCNLVLLAGMFLFRVEDKKEFYTYCIGRAFGFEILSVMLAFAYMAYVFYEWQLDGTAWYVTVPCSMILNRASIWRVRCWMKRHVNEGMWFWNNFRMWL